MKILLMTVLVLFAIEMAGGCTDPAFPSTGSAQFAVSARQDLASSISRVSVTSSAADIPSITIDLAPTNGVWGGVIGNIPAGANRSFLARAFDSSGTKLFEGSASAITITANQTALVAITLQEVNPPPPFQNEAPLIDTLVASSTAVTPGGSITLQVAAHDPNTGDTLTYAWSSTGGSWASTSAASTSWTAPLTQGIQTLTVSVTDSGGLSTSISLAVNVAASGGNGDARLSITFNSSPRVASLGASPTQLAVGQTTAVSVSASDPDGDSLSYSWSATCAGTWANASSKDAQFTPSALPANACNNCSLTVSVSDARGGQTTGTVALCVGTAPPINHFPPVIVRSYRSSDSASAGQVLTYEVVASDPESSALTFSWAATTGSLGTAVSTAFGSRTTWTAPSCARASNSPTITATITNAFNLQVTKSFVVTGMPECFVWSPTGSMATSRWYHTATLLPSGKVLVVGGNGNNSVSLASAELYSLGTGTWAPTGSMATGRFYHTATLLPSGKVLVTGGINGNNVATSAELYDPATGTWAPTGSMATSRYGHTATLLPSGKVLVAGGVEGVMTLKSAELYDPATGLWTSIGSMKDFRAFHSATLLPSGKVLVAGGASNVLEGIAEVYDPATGTWSSTGSMPSSRWNHTATLLPSGKVLVAGGGDSSGAFASVVVYDPATGAWALTAPMAAPRAAHAATLLSSGKVLVTGYPQSGNSLEIAEVYDPATETWVSANPMVAYRQSHTATLLPSGKVLVAGGTSALSNAELLDL